MSRDYLSEKISAIENTHFTQIPGPNPLLTPGEKGCWDDGMMEMCDILKDDGKYYLYYHCTGDGNSYRIGVAVADNPLGPFKKYGDKPVLDLASFGGSNDRYIACGSVIKESVDSYYLFYSLQQKDDLTNYYIGLAKANNPLGPWEKFEGNPIMKNFGYVGGVTKKDGKFYMFNEYPTRYQAQDYGPICMAVADRPEGPWEPIKNEPVMPCEDWGTWDDAGYSECNVKYDGCLFHMFYGGAKTNKDRLLSRESIGYAYSVDGKHFTKYSRNPVAHREQIAYGAAMAEVCFIAEYPYIYLYHTLRYSEPWYENEAHKFPYLEHVGVQVMCIADAFNVTMPVMSLPKLGGGETHVNSEKLPLTVSSARRFRLTLSAKYSDGCDKPLTVHAYAGDSETAFDTVDTYTFTHKYTCGEVRQSFPADVCAKFLKITVENPNKESVTDVKVSITLAN